MSAPPEKSPDDIQQRVPRPSLNLGVTGHRLHRLGDVDLDRLYEAIAAVLERVERGASQCAPTAITMISCIAEGADSIAIRAALARGWPVDVVLPFAVDDYARDFSEGKLRDDFVAQCAAARSVMELAGERTTAGDGGIAYERAGRVVLTQCDVLLAVWDGGPLRGRGGAAQIVAEAVALGIPVIQLDPNALDAPLLLWDGLTEHDVGQHSVETVPRGSLDALAPLARRIVCPPDTDNATIMDDDAARWSPALAYPLLLNVLGVRRLRRADLVRPKNGAAPTTGKDDLDGRIEAILRPRFERADAHAVHAAQLFRSGYVTNFSFAAIAVVLSLLGFALPASAKPVLVASELAVIGTILVVTRVGNRAGWHRRWLDGRKYAERLRCLGLSAKMGDLDLRADESGASPAIGWHVRAIARALGVPSVRIGAPYLAGVRDELVALIDGQIAYLTADARRMHTLEHRLHSLGTVLFGTTAVICVLTLALKASAAMHFGWSSETVKHTIAIALTIGSAALPALGAAIYGIRMQGDFAGIAERNEALAHHLSSLRTVIDADALSFDTLRRRVRRVSDLLTADLDSWLETYHARPLTLPG